jgi:hypothetical protein
VPVVAGAVIAWAGLNGAGSGETTVAIANPTAVDVDGAAATDITPAATPIIEAPKRPSLAIGLHVRPLAEIQPQALAQDDVVAISGWYAPLAITDCPPLAAIYRDGALPYLRGDTDPLAFCVRSGVLYASAPDGPQGDSAGGPSEVAATFVVGVIAPLRLEQVGADATEVVILGRFVEPSGRSCRATTCARVLLVDHVAWTPS